MMQWLLRLIFMLAAGSVTAQSFTAPPFLTQDEQELFPKWIEQVTQSKLKFAKANKLYLNELIASRSPYLLQHAFQPVNWKPWREDVLAKAKRDNQLIFLSIGYSTCHWCHVMARESFDDEAIAKIINENFIAIKVDREELPNVDFYYKSLLEIAQGSAGWPITVVINADGIPVFIDSYVKKDKLAKALTGLDKLWQSNPSYLLSTGQMLVAALENETLPQGQPMDWIIPEVFSQVARHLDKQHGGLTAAVKFPNDALLNFLTDIQYRAEVPQATEAAAKLVDGMLEHGLRDHIEGGFHRYTVDNAWQVPHFEKMLYNQSQIIIALERLYQLQYEAKLLPVIDETVTHLLTQFARQDMGFAAAFDAELNGIEGGYHLFTEQEIKSLAPLPNGFQRTPVNGRILLTLASDNVDQNTQTTLKQLRKIRRDRAPLHRDDKLLTGWNGAAISALARAGALSDNDQPLRYALTVGEAMWHRFDSREQTLARSNAALEFIYLEDYVLLAQGYLDLFDHTQNTIWLERATLLFQAADKFFISESKVFDSYPLKDGLSTARLHDDEITPPVAVFLKVAEGLHRRGVIKSPKSRYAKLLENLSLRAARQPQSHLTLLTALWQVELGTTDHYRYFAQGKGYFYTHCQKVVAEQCRELKVTVNLASGWHINSNTPRHDYLIPTAVAVPAGYQIEYPPAQLVQLGFEPQPLSVFEGRFAIVIKRPEVAASTRIELPLQACSDRVCLQPERFKLSF
ncbi:MAG: thioredoxin domain-containing protein [Gammaproteobacteria bacterium]|nr:thioredoxin domain-containing protein [Gammaproteobacteria bacterium]